MTPAPKRRWFRYSLRMLFVLVTVVCCWLGYELNWIRQRHAFLAKQRVVFEQTPTLGFPGTSEPVQGATRAPDLLSLFGESGVSVLLLQIFVENYDGADSDRYDEVRLAKQLFPEAQVSWLVFNAPASAASQRARAEQE
jgi:hypothetical protein